MPLKEIKSGNELIPIINQVDISDYDIISHSKEFSFNWDLEKGHEVYKIHLREKESEILGLISLIDWPSEYRIHLNLIEIGKTNRGSKKKIDNIAGCLLAFACKLAFKRGYWGFVSLQPKTRLIGLYRKKYGFQLYGKLMAVEQESSRQLIKTYLENENE